MQRTDLDSPATAAERCRAAATGSPSPDARLPWWRWCSTALVFTAIPVAAASSTVGCGDETAPAPAPPPDNPAGPGEICFTPSPVQVQVRVEPAQLVLAPGQTRSARVVVDPDFCSPREVHFTSEAPEVVPAPSAGEVSFGSPTIDLEITGQTVGTTILEVTVPRQLTDEGAVHEPAGYATAELLVDVREATRRPCSADDDVAPTLLEAGSAIAAGGSLIGATISLPVGADEPNHGSFLWSVSPFETSIACSDDLTPSGYVALGPAVTFGPADRAFPRDVPMTIPLNPALLPDEARLRHLRVAYAGPAFREPRTVPVTNPRLAAVNGGWALSFKAPRLGTYQAVVHEEAGTRVRSRRITHRAVLGVSMGAAGAASFGLRHHHLFDVVAPLGGPVDWTWLAHYIETNHVAGFRPIASGTTLGEIQLQKTLCTTDDECADDEICMGVIDDPPTSGKCTLMPEMNEPYGHPQTFDNWWYEYPRQGNGGRFPRDNYIQIFRDLALMFGNTNGYNEQPGGAHLPRGVDPDHPAQTGDHPNGECKIWVDPIDGHPDEEKQKEINDNCPRERCQYTQRLEGYYDDEFNPDGTFPVITFCDGSPQNELLTPYANTWTPEGNQYPMEVALAVDYNDNGVRDELEPVIRAGHERWDDYGPDQTPSMMEPGYGPNDLDPAGDDYHPQYAPSGTEGDHRFQTSEAFDDVGLDGVAGTAASPYDYGEGDGTFNAAPGLQRMWDFDARSVVLQTAPSVPGGPFDDDALARLDVWTDGGTRDLFNFALTAQHFAGGFVARGRDTAYFSGFTELPGQNPSTPEQFNPAHIVWPDLQGVINLRYGPDDPSPHEIETGSGQHVGTATEITRRIQTALYFMGSRWPDAPRTLVETSADKPSDVDPPCMALGCLRDCEVNGRCEFEFTSSDGRTGPVGVNLPPGYAHADLQHLRYPVIFMLHGYGQTPEDLLAAIAFLSNWMNGPTDSQASRLPKAIMVYVDGRCRPQDGKAECLRGTFYTDSARPDGPQMEKWWLELMDYVDQSFRTMGESTIEWRE